MILELALIIIILYVLYIQHTMHQPPDDSSRYIDETTASPNIPIPRTRIVTQPPIVTPKLVTAKRAILDVTPAWFQSVKPIVSNKIRFPIHYDETSSIDTRTYNCLSSFRSMTKKIHRVDFVAEPFISTVENPETLVVILNELAHQIGVRLAFTHENFQYNDSDYRTACGVTNLGSIHSFLASEGNFLTAKFNLHLNFDYKDITASIDTLRSFVLTIINDISILSQCNKDFIRVFSVSQVASILVGFGITTPKLDETKKIAELLKQKLNRVKSVPRHGIFQHLIPEKYEYKLEPALTFLQLQASDFEPHYNRAYHKAREEIRGGYPYYLPQGWYRHALKVVDKYQDHRVWLGMNNSPGEWAVAYHGTRSVAAKGIVHNGLLHSLVTADACKKEAMKRYPLIPDVKGLYVATHCQGGAADYSSSFNVKDSTGVTKKYQLVFQCRIEPGKFTEHKGPVQVGMAWRVFDEKAIRPYGLLLQSS